MKVDRMQIPSFTRAELTAQSVVALRAMSRTLRSNTPVADHLAGVPAK
jgi:hypothetical protein